MKNILPTTPFPLWKDKFHLPLIFWLTSGVGVIALIAGGLFYLLSPKSFNNLKNKISEGLGNQNISTPTPTPIPPRPIPHGKIGFTVGQSDKTVPLFGRGFIDPYDPGKGATQTVTIAVKYKQPVTKVTAVLKTDHAVSTPVPFTLISGTNTDGEWQGSWQITDTYLYIYALALQAESAGSKPASVEVTLR